MCSRTSTPVKPPHPLITPLYDFPDKFLPDEISLTVVCLIIKSPFDLGARITKSSLDPLKYGIIPSRFICLMFVEAFVPESFFKESCKTCLAICPL